MRNKHHTVMGKANKGIPIAGLLTQNERQWLIGLKKDLQKNGHIR